MSEAADVSVGGGRSKRKLAREAVLEAVKAVATARGVTLQVFDPQSVYGREHLESAAKHADRARRRGDTIASDLGAEIALYAAGERQINKALKRVGLAEEVTLIAVVALGPDAPGAIDELLAALKMSRDDTALSRKPEALVRLGVRRIEGIDPLELVLEKVALLDALK